MKVVEALESDEETLMLWGGAVFYLETQRAVSTEKRAHRRSLQAGDVQSLVNLHIELALKIWKHCLWTFSRAKPIQQLAVLVIRRASNEV
jgi:hypothetical protein